MHVCPLLLSGRRSAGKQDLQVSVEHAQSLLSDGLSYPVLLFLGPVGEHWQPREDGTHHEGVSHPQ